MSFSLVTIHANTTDSKFWKAHKSPGMNFLNRFISKEKDRGKKSKTALSIIWKKETKALTPLN